MSPNKNPATDGGRRLRADDGERPDGRDSSGAGALGGTATGAAIGANFGPGGVVGGAIFGAILGDEIEKSATRNRKKKEMKTTLVEYLLRNRILPPETISSRRVLHWIPPRNRELAERALEELVYESDSPVTKTERGQIRLEDVTDAVIYLRRRDRDVPPIPEETEGES